MEAQLTARQRLAVALDVATADEALTLAKTLAPVVGTLKLGLELFTAEGPRLLPALRELGVDVFLDLKLHDIPATMARATAAARAHGVRYLTVHASAGREALCACRESAGDELELLAVTVLTSLDDAALRELELHTSTASLARSLAAVAYGAGLSGFVSSASEVAVLRAQLGPEALLVTPGIRPSGAATDDQKRIATPERALAEGASMLVMGRPIRDAADPRAAAEAVCRSIEAARA